MKVKFIIFFLVFISFSVTAQTDSIDTDQELLDDGGGINFGKEGDNRPPKVKPQDTFIVVAEMPEFIGGEDSMMRFIFRNLVYPQAAREKNIVGRVRVKFIVNETGEILNPRITSKEKLGYGCEEAAIDVILKMPKWKPGKQNGRAVNVYYNLPVMFKL